MISKIVNEGEAVATIVRLLLDLDGRETFSHTLTVAQLESLVEERMTQSLKLIQG